MINIYRYSNKIRYLNNKEHQREKNRKDDMQHVVSEQGSMDATEKRESELNEGNWS